MASKDVTMTVELDTTELVEFLELIEKVSELSNRVEELEKKVGK
jgi:hypothetical protein